MSRQYSVFGAMVATTIDFESNRAGYRLRRYGYGRNDVEQEFALEWIRSESRFNPQRASEQTFAAHVFRTHTLSLVELATATKRGAGVVCDFSELPFIDGYGNPIERPEKVSQDGCEMRLGRRSRHRYECADLRMDLARVLATVPPELAIVARTLMFDSVGAAAASLRLSRTTIYRRIAMLRKVFTRAGLHRYLVAGRAA